MKYASTYNGHVYVQAIEDFDAHSVIEYLVVASDLKDAKTRFAYFVHQREESTVRRATWGDIDRLGGLGAVRER